MSPQGEPYFDVMNLLKAGFSVEDVKVRLEIGYLDMSHLISLAMAHPGREWLAPYARLARRYAAQKARKVAS